VLDDSDGLHGWASVDRLTSGQVSDHARRMAAWVPVDAPLKAAFAAMLQEDAGWVAVLDGNTFLGVLTPNTLHEALRRSVDADALSVHPDDIDVESVSAV
jgi:osmoprotectant transport system ATP-binding protein